MSKEKQIEEMQEVLESTCDKVECKFPFNCDLCHARHLYNAGYRKQSEGEWRNLAKVGVYMCTACTQLSPQPYSYCPKCGAKMKGGEE